MWYHGGKNWTVTHGFDGRASPADQAFDQCFEIALDIISERGLGGKFSINTDPFLLQILSLQSP